VKQGLKFTSHRQIDHNPWFYIYFLTHIKLINQSDLNGTESYILEKWEKDDISWFPIGRAGALKELKEEEDAEEEILLKKFGKFLERFSPGGDLASVVNREKSK
jgi:hypothetical protein